MGRLNSPGDGIAEVDDFLEHYGVKGMKWGVRRGDSPRKASYNRKTTVTKQPVRKLDDGTVYPVDRMGRRISDDAARANIIKIAAKGHGTDVLSNRQLQELNNRLNLEQNYSRLNPKTQSVGKQFAVAAIKVAAPIAVTVFSAKLGPYAGIAKTVADAIAKKR